MEKTRGATFLPVPYGEGFTDNDNLIDPVQIKTGIKSIPIKVI